MNYAGAGSPAQRAPQIPPPNYAGKNEVRPTRLIEHAIGETARANGRIYSLIEVAKGRADRLVGSQPEAPNGGSGQGLTATSGSETASLMDSLASLHAALDELDSQMSRLEQL